MSRDKGKCVQWRNPGTWSRCVKQTFFVDTAMQAEVDSYRVAFPHRRRRPHEGPAVHAAMLETNNSYVRSFVPIDEQLQSGLLPQSVINASVDRAWTRYTMCCCFRTAPTSFTWSSRRLAGRSRSPLWNTTAGDWRPGNVVLCGDRLFQQYIVDACAKMEQQRLNYLRFNQNNHTVCKMKYLCCDVSL